MPSSILRLLSLAFVSVALVSAQEPDYTLKIDVPLVSVDITVQDGAGNLVSNLSRDAFEVYENGIRQQIRYFSPVATPYNVFLLFDRSGSTQHKWVFMERAVAGFIASLRPQDRMAIATFDSRFQAQLEWTADRRKAVLALPELVNPAEPGETNLYDSLERVVRREFKKLAGRRAVVVLTDGRDTSLYRELAKTNRLLEPSQDRGFQKALKAGREERIPVYFVAVNTDRNLEPNTLRDEYHNLQILFPGSAIPQQYLFQVRIRMEQIAEVSGGRILFPERIDDIIPLYQQLGRELGMSYSIGYLSSNPLADGSFRRIEVRTPDTRQKLSQSRDGYYAR